VAAAAAAEAAEANWALQDAAWSRAWQLARRDVRRAVGGSAVSAAGAKRTKVAIEREEQ
jgi:hypothetical protein